MNIESLLDEIADRLAQRLASKVPSDGGAVQARLMTVRETAKYLSSTPEAIRGRIKRGQLPAVRLGGSVFVDRRRVDEIIDSLGSDE